MARFKSLYQVFNYKYFYSGSPLPVQHLTPLIEALRNQRNIELMRAALAQRPQQ